MSNVQRHFADMSRTEVAEQLAGLVIRVRAARADLAQARDAGDREEVARCRDRLTRLLNAEARATNALRKINEERRVEGIALRCLKQKYPDVYEDVLATATAAA